MSEPYDPNELNLEPNFQLKRATAAALQEAIQAKTIWPPFNSAHEAFAILLEEVTELERHVFQKQRDRVLTNMKHEAIQVAAMALRFASEVCDEERGRR